jgi:predicted nucleic acid-binding Zn ribbon protein
VEAVGPEIAAHCKPVLFKQDTLEVTVDSSVWCQQLQLQSPEILAALREVLGDRAPSGLWFRVG